MRTKLALTACAAAVAASLYLDNMQVAQSDEPLAKDPGVRTGDPGSGKPFAALTRNERAFFASGKEDFEEAESVGEGLGPTMNLDSCAGCHSQPAIGGSSPAENPQVAFASKLGASNRVPSFIRKNGPVREARFVRNPDGTPDGGVHSLFTIAGRSDAPGCGIAQPDFEAQVARRNVIFRIPTPVFGAGLIEAIPDKAILANQAALAAERRALGIVGRANIVVPFNTVSGQGNNNGNDGTIARFGWKAQNKSLLLFSGEAYNVEMGISNELFPTERDETPACNPAATPNDVFNAEEPNSGKAVSAIQRFTFFMRMLAPPQPSAEQPGGGASIARGRFQFQRAGCALCHTPQLFTGNSALAATRYQPVNLYSDLLTHDMGVGLADGVTQGQAGPREFRTAPLWGLGQRLFFLHDGRASDLIEAIRAHASPGSEANAVVARYALMREADKQDLLNFMRSL